MRKRQPHWFRLFLSLAKIALRIVLIIIDWWNGTM
jgi:hypothetical protein